MEMFATALSDVVVCFKVNKVLDLRAGIALDVVAEDLAFNWYYRH